MRTLLLLVSGCSSWLPHRDDLPSPTPPPVPVAIEGINSPYDDFNAADMSGAYRDTIVFSTNRGSEGNHFDLYQATIDLARPSDEVPAHVSARDVVPFQPSLMSDGDERGPIHLSSYYAPVGSRGRFVFASDRAGGEGGLDLYSAECEQGCSEPLGFRALTGLDTPGDDAYLAYSPVEHQLLLASNERAGAPLDIYAATWDAKDTIDSVPSSRAVIAELSSDADDTAPFVYFTDAAREHGEVIFASARAGGLGEHDLYCARFVDPRTDAQREDEDRRAKIRGWTDTHRVWSKPVLLRELSSPRDEYRPMVFERLGTRYLVFSSTREGGQGGYDLYIVGYGGCPRA